MNSHPVQELVRLVVQFMAPLENNSLVDPTAVSVTITPPNGLAPDIVDSTSGIIRDDVGSYHYDFVPGIKGLWIYRFQGTGVVIASSGNMFFRCI
jgi:hypothetical protein